MTRNPETTAGNSVRVTEAATIERASGTGAISVHIGGAEVVIRVKPDGRLYVWVEVDGEDAQLLHPETGCLPVKMGVCDSVVFETDTRGLGAESDVFETDSEI